jgi:hypothetical protein
VEKRLKFTPILSQEAPPRPMGRVLSSRQFWDPAQDI